LTEVTSAAVTAEHYVELKQLSKHYGSLKANDEISLTVKPGEIHVLVGENGAGKSTLMGMLSGTVVPDSGQILLDGQDVTGFDAREAIARGVGMVHQHFRLVGAFTVAENIALGFEPRGRFRLLDRGQALDTAREVSERFGLALDLNASIDDMSVGMQQRVEIVKTLARNAKVLIFDEPTAVLTEDESEALFVILRRLRDDGRAIIFITHKLREAIGLGDTISVLRRGQLVATVKPAETTVSQLGVLMVGREVAGTQRVAKPVDDQQPVLLQADNVSMASRTLHGVALRELTVTVRSGQILGILGVDGNGQQEVVALLTGLSAPDAGTISIKGKDLTGMTNGAFLKAGLGVIPGDRHLEGLVLPMSLARNLILDRRDEKQFQTAGGLLIKEKAVTAYAGEMITKYDIRAQGARQSVGSLSGGNQQKVVIARELERQIDVLVAANPTRGLDVGSIEFVHKQLIAMADRGNAVVVVTADLDEAMAVSDSIAVLYHGSIIGVVVPPFDRHEIGILMGGK
jgi:ABC-type uncharacterized transport system ATPase subunit